MCMFWCSDCERSITGHLTLHGSKVHGPYTCVFTLTLTRTECTEDMGTNKPLPEQVDTLPLSKHTHVHRLGPK